MAGSAFLYSTSPSPHELVILQQVQRSHPGHRRPISAVVLQTPLDEPGDLHGLEQHFCTKGIDVRLVDSGLHTREDAYRSAVVQRLAEADLVLITGGSPLRIHEATVGTPALAALRAAHDEGAVIAGCSAGALVLGVGMINGSRDARKVQSLWGWLPSTLVAPHFGNYDLDPWLNAFPTCTVLGIPDGAMALVSQLLEVEAVGPEPLKLVRRGDTSPLTVTANDRIRLP
ncbi:Type 1 glutamine amidotransferase-like domain-containing protein [Kribbella jiaozuonensis]|uniref:Uncharacterized protein n=1 Tax=Kribbella jiaozuonensis TaxID=2575441 RepID=A0A4U3LPF4_9ACTN|nr:Type 1 glutamine amidotransferase-like domain-containing protein [Kribbella jiaozuonensis]TKK77718.1 hypothetical protein FDA38_21480 [Kribbella jiaozuonensis]